MSNNYPGNPYNVVASSGFQPNSGNYQQMPNYPAPNMMQGGPPPMYSHSAPPQMYNNTMHPQNMGGHGYHGGAQPQYNYPPQRSGGSYSFLDPIIPTEKQESLVQNLLKPQTSKITEVYKKLYVGKIPSDVKDSMIERLLKSCGPIEYWKRAIDASSMPKGFGYCEFEDVDGALVCIKTMSGLKVGNSTLVVSISPFHSL
jgi:hypothetical protein